MLTFCADGGTERDTFERDVKAYFKTLDDAQKEEFRARFDAVMTLAQNIAKGDVEQSDLEQADDLKDFDPVTFQHDNLETFHKTVRGRVCVKNGTIGEGDSQNRPAGLPSQCYDARRIRSVQQGPDLGPPRRTVPDTPIIFSQNSGDLGSG